MILDEPNDTRHNEPPGVSILDLDTPQHAPLDAEAEAWAGFTPERIQAARERLEGCEAPRLDNRWSYPSPSADSDTPDPAEQARKRREWRKTSHSRQAYLWKHSSIKSLRLCGRSALGGSVDLRLGSSGVATFGGLARCSSHACPRCSGALAATRRGELAAAIREHERRGGHFALLTLTMRHDDGANLGEFWGALSYAWGAVASGARWKSERAEFGVIGFTRAVELMVKPGRRGGWDNADPHLHTHVVLFLDRPLDELGRTRLEAGIVGRWIRALERRGLSALPRGQDLRAVTGNAASLGEYFTKSADSAEALAYEMTSGASKDGRRRESVPPFAVLSEAIAGDAGALRWWRNYEQVQRGRRRLLWSRELRGLLGLDDELDDDDAAEAGDDDERVTVADTFAVLDAGEWKRLVSVPWRIPKLLDVAERRGALAALERLEAWGIKWSAPPEQVRDTRPPRAGSKTAPSG